MSNEELDLNILFQEISSIISRNIYNVTGGIIKKNENNLILVNIYILFQ